MNSSVCEADILQCLVDDFTAGQEAMVTLSPLGGKRNTSDDLSQTLTSNTHAFKPI